MYKSQIQTWNNTIFLRRCRKLELIPNSINLQFLTKQFGHNNHIHKLQDQMKKKLLHTLIKTNFQNLYEIDKNIYHLKTTIRQKVPTFWGWICHLMNHTKNNINTQVKRKQVNKINVLIKKKIEHSLPRHPQIQNQPTIKGTIHNLSNHTLTENETSLLNLGLNFAFPVTDIRIPMMDTAASIELKMYSLDIEEFQKDQIRSGVSHIMKTQVQKHNHIIKWERWMSSTIKSLKIKKTFAFASLIKEIQW
jgi:hypothetical protein